MQTNILQLMAVVCAASSLPALIASIRKIFHEKNVLNFIVAICCGVLTATYVSAIFQVEHFISLLRLWPETQRLSSLIPQIGMALTLCCIAGNMLVWVSVRKVTTDNLWRWILIVLGGFLLLMVIIGAALTVMTGLSFDTCFFGSCCGFMGASGVAWGLSYKEICVIGNIYLESGLCLLSALWLTWVCVKRYLDHKTIANGLIMTTGCIYGLASVVAFICICVHYAMPMDDAFDLCYRELNVLAAKWNTTYNNVNYILFMTVFLVLFAGNLLLAKLIHKKGVIHTSSGK